MLQDFCLTKQAKTEHINLSHALCLNHPSYYLFPDLYIDYGWVAFSEANEIASHKELMCVPQQFIH